MCKQWMSCCAHLVMQCMHPCFFLLQLSQKCTLPSAGMAVTSVPPSWARCFTLSSSPYGQMWMEFSVQTLARCVLVLGSHESAQCSTSRLKNVLCVLCMVAACATKCRQNLQPLASARHACIGVHTRATYCSHQFLIAMLAGAGCCVPGQHVVQGGLGACLLWCQRAAPAYHTPSHGAQHPHCHTQHLQPTCTRCVGGQAADVGAHVLPCQQAMHACLLWQHANSGV